MLIKSYQFNNCEERNVWTKLDKIENKLGKTCDIQIKSYQFRNCKQNEKIEKIEEKLIEKYVGKKRSTTSTQLKQNVTFAIVFKLTFNLWREL